MARGLEGALAGVPGLAGFLGGIQNDQANTAGQLGQITQVQQIAGVMQQAQQRQAAMQREAAFRAELQALGPNPSQEALAQVASRYAAPGDVLKTQQGSLDRQAQIAATKEKAFATLAETARMNDARIDKMIAETKDAAERTALMKTRDEMRAFYNNRALAIAGERLFYDTGTRLPEATPPAPPPAQTGPLSTVQGDFGGVGVNLQGVSPAALAAVRADPAAQGNPALQAALGGAPAAPTAVPSPAPAPTPTPPAGAAPAAPVAAPVAAPATTPAAPVSGFPQMPPEIARLPKKMQDQWAVAQAKKTGTEKAMPADAINKLRDNQQNLKRAERALDLVSGKGVGSQIPDANATGIKGLMPDFMLQRVDPQGVDARAAIADLGSLVIHQRSGAAVTAAEFPRLAPFIPKASDAPEVVRKKLQRFVEVYREEVNDTVEFFRLSGFKVPDLNAAPAAPANATPSPAASGPVRISSDEDYEKLPSGATYIGPDGKQRRKR